MAATQQATDQTCAADASGGSKKNPLLQDWIAELGQPFGLPPFHVIKPQHFTEALDVARQQHITELQKIVDVTETPNFENVYAAFDRTGRLLDRVSAVFR